MKPKQGFTLIEVVVALVILTVSFTTLFVLFKETLNQTKISSDLWRDFVFLDTAYKLENKIFRREITYFRTNISYIIYSYGKLSFLTLRKEK
jgi:prepilin-type N-terminal cleavage/methylation domain-containing protein